MKLENIAISTKLGIGFGVLIVFSLILSITGWNGLTGVIRGGDHLIAIQGIDRVIGDTTAARKNYLRTMAEKDKQQLATNIDTIISSLSAEQTQYSNNEALTKIKQAIAAMTEYKGVFERLAQLMDDKAAKINMVLVMNQRINDMQVHQVSKLEHNANGAVNWRAIAELNAVSTEMEQLEQTAKSWLVVGSADQSIISDLNDKTDAISAKLEKIATDYQLSSVSTTAKALVALKGQYQQLVKLDLAVDDITKEFAQSAKTVVSNINGLQAFQTKRLDDANFWAKTLLIVVSVLSIAIGVLSTTVIARQIAKPLHDAVALAAEIAKGDLTHVASTSRKDEIGQLQQAMVKMTAALRNLISNVSSGIAELSSSATQLAAVTEQNRSGMRKQHQEIEQVATAMNEMSTTVHEVARNAEHAAEATSSAEQVTNDGNAVIGEAVAGVQQLNHVIDSTADAMDALAKQSDKIGTVLEVIKSVAEQTNLLALNAAIEAARAGEAGRGFAVVADEVRNLAQRTQQSTSEIETMIQLLQNETQNAMKMMTMSKDIADENGAKAGSVGALFEKIAQAVEEMQAMNHQIATAAEEQSVVAEEINRRVSDVNDIADQTAVSSNETAESTERLAALGAQLQSSIAGFKIR